MHDDDPRLLLLTRAIADGSHVDWEAADRLAAESDEAPLFAALRTVAHIAWFHRVQHVAAGGAASAAPSAGSGASGAPSSNARTTPPGGTPRPAAVATGSSARASGQRWCHLEIRSKLDEGVFGEVYLAWDPTLEREVALKLLRAAGPGISGAGGIAPHLLQEARNLARLRHPNIVAVYGAESADGRVGIWMEYVRGRNLEDLLHERGTFGAREAALVGIDLCRALTAVHRAGLVHRDVKAKNVLREDGGRIVLMDFGTGAELRADAPVAARLPAGTPVYLAPEIFKGRPATPQSDVYSLGVLLYHMVSSSFPVQGESLRDIALAHERGTPRLLREERPDLPEAFLHAVERALARRPEDRFASAGQLEQALVMSLT
jgi:serine/threonine-protein kinase